jgi:hypothetical protein
MKVLPEASRAPSTSLNRSQKGHNFQEFLKKKPHPDANKMEKQVQSSDDADRG